MPPTHSQEATRALGKMDAALRELGRKWHRIKRTPAYKKGQKGARDEARETLRSWRNLKKVIEALRKADIAWAVVRGREIAHATTNPPKVTVMSTYRAMRDEVLAQVLAHEAIHLLSKAPRNSIDEEVRCRRKEVEVWALLKGGGAPNALDYLCNNVQKRLALGEAAMRKWLRQVYRGIPEKGPKPAKKKKRKKGTMRIERARSLPMEIPHLFAEFLTRLVQLFTIGPLTEQEYSFDAAWPPDYTGYETTGHDTPFAGVIGVSDHQGERGLPAVLSVIEAPDIIHGGEWGSYLDEVEHQRAVMEFFNAEVLDVDPVRLVDEPREVLGQPGHCVEVEYNVVHPAGEIEQPWSRLRQRTLHTQRDEVLYSISLCTEAAVWDQHEHEIDMLLSTLELPAPVDEVTEPGLPEEEEGA